MNKLVLLVVTLLLACGSVFGREGSFATYELVARRGNVSVVTRNGEYRMLVGVGRRPHRSLLLGTTPETAASQIDYIAEMGADENYTSRDRIVPLCGECFFLNVSGRKDAKHYSFRGIDRRIRFELSEEEVRELREEILN